MPKPTAAQIQRNEQSEFISDCISQRYDELNAKGLSNEEINQKQQVAICFSIWDRATEDQ